jgi:RNA polymerase sigma-B factor
VSAEPLRAACADNTTPGIRERCQTESDMSPVVNKPAIDALLATYRRDGDTSAREEIVVEFLPMVRGLAARYAGRGEPMDDLVQVGCIGLIKALDRFDLDRGVNFTSYAIPTIIGEIRRYFRDKTWALHVPRPIKELSVRLNRVVEDLTAQIGRPPTVSELATASGASMEDVIDALECTAAYSTRSLDSPFDQGGDETLSEMIGGPEQGFQGVEDTSVVVQALSSLAERERLIVRMRFFEEKTQSQIAAELGISQMHVSRLLRKALETMNGQIGPADTGGGQG